MLLLALASSVPILNLVNQRLIANQVREERDPALKQTSPSRNKDRSAKNLVGMKIKWCRQKYT